MPPLPRLGHTWWELSSWADPALHPLGPSLVGDSWGFPESRGREGGLSSPLPMPGPLCHLCHLHPSVPSPSFALPWSCWDRGKLNIIPLL